MIKLPRQADAARFRLAAARDTEQQVAAVTHHRHLIRTDVAQHQPVTAAGVVVIGLCDGVMTVPALIIIGVVTGSARQNVIPPASNK